MKRKLALIFADIFLMVFSYIAAFILRFEFEGALGQYAVGKTNRH